MGLDNHGLNGLALGAWGAVQATCAGTAVLLGGVLRDVVSALATQGWLGSALASPATGYSFVYHLELLLLFATLVAIGPLVRNAVGRKPSTGRFGLAEHPG
jgi:BCD family chlorophyll transporter-like MFS transporter